MARVHSYRLKTIWTGGAHGPTSTYAGYSREYVVEFDGKPSLRGSADATFRGDPALYNPEDLLVAALSTCHMLSYLALCARAGVEVVAYDDDATGTMARKDGKVRFTEVVLRPRVVVASEDDLKTARALHAAAHDACFIANSVNFPVGHQATVATADVAHPGD